MDKVIHLILCHLVGDYVLQCDFIAKTKGSNLYHLFVHCALYCLPFILLYGIDWKIGVLFVSHIIIDVLKARFNKISYIIDQILHYIVLFIFLF